MAERRPTFGDTTRVWEVVVLAACLIAVIGAVIFAGIGFDVVSSTTEGAVVQCPSAASGTRLGACEDAQRARGRLALQIIVGAGLVLVVLGTAVFRRWRDAVVLWGLRREREGPLQE